MLNIFFNTLILRIYATFIGMCSLFIMILDSICLEFKNDIMNKRLLFGLLLFLTVSVKAQNPDADLLNQTWYLHEVYDSDFDETFSVNGYQPYAGSPEIEQITPNFILDDNLNFSGIGICNSYTGVLEYDIMTNSFRTISTDVETSACGFYEDMDEPLVIGPLGFVDSDPLSYTIIDPMITNDSDGYQTLSFVTQPFVRYTYRNVSVLSVQDFKKNVFTVYPNPTSDVIQFSSDRNLTIISAHMYSVFGRLVMDVSSQDFLDTVQISSLDSGIYFIKVASAEGVEIHRIIKK